MNFNFIGLQKLAHGISIYLTVLLIPFKKLDTKITYKLEYL